MTEETRGLSREEARKLRAGSDHYTAFVGPPRQWDFMGATQFRLLCALGLREHHKVLDLGCGSLRAGRLLIVYLEKGGYHGMDPNGWLIEEAIEKELGADLVRLKEPCFYYSANFAISELGNEFDFIIAQSVFSHAGPSMVRSALGEIAANLAETGLALVTFILAEVSPAAPVEVEGWLYPECLSYRTTTIETMLYAAGLVGRQLPWFHPRQTWFALSRSLAVLPSPIYDRHLSGAVLCDSEFAASL